MVIKDALVPEFDHEIGTLRRLLDRLPEDKIGWKPHEKSYTLGQLASHLVHLPRWGLSILDEPFFDLAAGTETAEERQKRTVSSRRQALELLDKNAAAFRARLVSKQDVELMAPWELRRGATPLMTLPRITAIRSLIMNHLIHHRGQFSLYLRLNDVPLPPIYGPSADEGQM